MTKIKNNYKRVNLIMKPSHNCNFNCAYCYDRFNRAISHEIMPKEDVVMSIKKFYDWTPCLNVIWHGGEPTLLGINYMEWVMNQFKDCDITWGIQTNGSLIAENPKEWFDFASRWDLTFGVSFDGFSDGNERNQVDIEKLISYWQKYEGKVGLSLLMTVTPKNASSLSDTIIYANKYKLGVGLNELFDFSITDEEYKKMADGILDAFRIICSSNIELNRPFIDFIRYYVGLDERICSSLVCINHWFSIGPDGTVYPCGKYWTKEWSYGNIYKNSIEEILSSPIQTKLLKVKKAHYDHCYKCKWFKLCQNGCIKDTLYQPTYVDEVYCRYKTYLWNEMNKILTNYLTEEKTTNRAITLLLNDQTKRSMYETFSSSL